MSRPSKHRVSERTRGSKLDDAKYLSGEVLNEAAFMTFMRNHEET